MLEGIVYIALVVGSSVAAIGGNRAVGSRAGHGGAVNGQGRS